MMENVGQNVKSSYRLLQKLFANFKSTATVPVLHLVQTVHSKNSKKLKISKILQKVAFSDADL